MADWLDIDKRVNNAVNMVDQLADRRIRQINDMLDEKIEEIRLLLNGIKVTVNLEASQVAKGESANQKK
jgi:hypothetical protein